MYMGKIKYTPPEWLEAEAKEYISEVVKELNQGKNLKKIDLAAINMLAISYSTFIQASKQTASEGTTIMNYREDPVKHPAVNIASDFLTKAMRIITEYGLTLKSREALPVTKSDPSENSALEQFIGKKR